LRLTAFVLFVMAACSLEATEPVVTPEVPTAEQRVGEAFGTTWMVKWHGASVDDGAIDQAIATTLDRVDARMSTWRPDSELSRVRGQAGPRVVSEETAEVVEAALQLARVTQGAFDPTVQPLMELWGFHGTRREGLPGKDELARARAQVGWERVSVVREEGTASVDAGGTALDLSAIAKGHAVDQVALALTGLGLRHMMVEIGGEVRVAGLSPAQQPWSLGVDLPDAKDFDGRPLAGVIQLTDGALATSGNYRNTYEAEGKTLVHIMDPRTGWPVLSSVASVSVTAPDCRTADGWATALMVLGLEEGRAEIEALQGVEAVWLIAGPKGFYAEMTQGMVEQWADAQPPAP
jgi:thiamine biosynthesis lipoprotein